MKNLDFLINSSEAEKFLSQNCKLIFGDDYPIKLIDLSRAETYNQRDSYNVLYTVSVSGVTRFVRGSASKSISKKEEYQVLKHCYENGFGEGNFLTPKPLFFFPDFNLMFYENIEGNFLMKGLGEDLNKLLAEMELCSKAINKFHKLPKPNFKVWDPGALFNCNLYERQHVDKYYPNFGSQINKILEKIFKESKKITQNQICHTDFQPTNIIIENRKLYILDLGMTSIFDVEYDIASFINQLRVMLMRFGNPDNFKPLSEAFISGCDPFNQHKFDVYSLLSNIRILITFCLTNLKIGNEKYMPVVNKLIQSDLKRLFGIAIDDKY